jgi:hypothetical protein
MAHLSLHSIGAYSSDLPRNTFPTTPVLGHNTTHRQLQGVVDHDGHEDKTQGRIGTEYQMGHWHPGGQGLLGAAEDSGNTILSG